ncbi:putative PUA-like domain-containing protein [Lupinus albus]|uniref:Putative PUA-like domain-containing protein n=1 Tax=Lupinus albus TaxID=3870 RepID=A0A6A4PG06_LUPAL|nr:putative PUA-like domain-containing protein [Lupinus albus]
MKKGGDDNESGWMRDCIDSVVKFTLQSHSHLINLSPQFCSKLLKHDPTYPSLHSQHSLKGVPLYPLYKHLASSLFCFMDSESFCWKTCNSTMTLQHTFMHHKHNHCHKLILDKGSQLLNILRSVSFELHVQEPFFSQLKDGLKTIEGRCATSKYSRIELGDLILINKSMVFEVQGIRQYPTFSDMLEAERMEKVLPGVESVEEGLEVYRRFYTEEKELENGVLAIIISKVAFQPYILLANLFSGLSYEGVQGLLGLMHTTGTNSDALPPSKSTLLASFNLPCNPNVKK